VKENKEKTKDFRQVVTRLVHFMYTGELVAGAGQLGELRSLAQTLGAAALLDQIACLEVQLTSTEGIFSIHRESPRYRL
jgi:hypothetical protein